MRTGVCKELWKRRQVKRVTMLKYTETIEWWQRILFPNDPIRAYFEKIFAQIEEKYSYLNEKLRRKQSLRSWNLRTGRLGIWFIDTLKFLQKITGVTSLPLYGAIFWLYAIPEPTSRRGYTFRGLMIVDTNTIVVHQKKKRSGSIKPISSGAKTGPSSGIPTWLETKSQYLTMLIFVLGIGCGSVSLNVRQY